MMSKQRILNIDVDNVTLAELLEKFITGMLVTPNVDHLITLQHQKEFVLAYRQAAFSVVDSQIVFWTLKWMGRSVKEKISGSDFLPAFCDHHARRNLQGIGNTKIFLLGGKSGVADRAMQVINDRAATKIIVGAHSPSMSFATDEAEIRAVIEMINATDAETLVVGLGAPKQELWISTHKHRFSKVHRFLAVGASIDFEAGTINRSPSWMSKFGLEWLFRLKEEPRRLWKRYLVRDPLFFFLVFKDWIGMYKDPFTSNK
jgi:N-acetylglucosaminyldiphosphoundecaprenol N-acetyl-beta-D-mannosaminyltransferase